TFGGQVLSGGSGAVAGVINAPVVVNGTISPGSPGYPYPQSAGTTGILQVGSSTTPTFMSADLTINGGKLAIQVNNPAGNTPTAGVDYDQVSVNNGGTSNTVNLNNLPTLNTSGSALTSAYPAGKTLQILNSNGDLPLVNGTFNN